MPRTIKAAEGAKRHPLGMRTTKETRERLERAASANGRSLAQEVEARLERSFAEEDAFGGREVYRLAQSFAHAFIKGGTRAAHLEGHPEWGPSEWMNDPKCYLAAEILAQQQLEFFRPGRFDPDPERRRLAAEQYAALAEQAGRAAVTITADETPPPSGEELDEAIARNRGGK